MPEIVAPTGLTVTTSRAVKNLADFCNVGSDEVGLVLRDMIMPGASGAEMIAFAMVCLSYKLDPLKREIYAFKHEKTGIWQAGLYVDGWLTLINRHVDFAGMEIEMVDHPQTGKPLHCTVTIHHKSRPERPTVVTEYYDECRNDKWHWTKWPHRQLRHKGIIQCARVAFGFAGLGDAQELQDRPDDLAKVVSGSRPALTRLNQSLILDAPPQPAGDEGTDVGHEEPQRELPPAEDPETPPPAPDGPPADVVPPKEPEPKPRSRTRRAKPEAPPKAPPKAGGDLPLSDNDIMSLLD
jgi:hypothetical protein